MYSSSLFPARGARVRYSIVEPLVLFYLPIVFYRPPISPSFILPRHSHIPPHRVLPSQRWPSPFPASFILTKWPAHLILLLTNLPLRLHCIPTSFLRSFIVLLSTLFVLVIRRTQLFSQTCSLWHNAKHKHNWDSY